MTDRRRPPSKKDVMLDLLAKSGVFVHLDPRRDGVVVPQDFKKKPELVLQIGLNMAVAIRDLEVDDEGISCTLSFNRSPFWCRMPWHAVFALVSDEDQRGAVWGEDAPRESKMSRATKIDPPRPRLRAVGPDERAPEPAPPPPDAALVAGEGRCGDCGTKWLEDQDSCPLCGASREEAFRGAAGAKEEDDDLACEPNAKIPLALRAFTDAGDPPEPEEPSAADPDAMRAMVPPLRGVPDPAEPMSEPLPEAASAEPTDDDEDAPAATTGKAKRAIPPWLRVVK